MRTGLLTGFVVILLSGCGGGRDVPPAAQTGIRVIAPGASGPIGTACLIADRRAASPGLCGCVQAAADISLSSSDQKRGATFFNDPLAIQTMQLSDTPEAEAFWDRWKAFSELSQSMCTTI